MRTIGRMVMSDSRRSFLSRGLALVPFSQGNLKLNADLWRAGLPALGCEAALKSATSLCQAERNHRFCDCFAAERGQARSPHVLARLDSVFD